MFCCCHPCHRNSFGRQSKARCSLHLSGSGSPPPSCFAPWLLISLCLYTAVAPYLSHPGSRPTTDKAEFIFPPRLPRQGTSIPGSQISKKEESRTLVSGFFLLLLFVVCFFQKTGFIIPLFISADLPPHLQEEAKRRRAPAAAAQPAFSARLTQLHLPHAIAPGPGPAAPDRHTPARAGLGLTPNPEQESPKE